MLKIYISRFGHDEIELSVQEGTTVRQVFAMAGLELTGREEAYVSGVRATMQSILEDNDVVNIVTPKQAGSEEEETS
jgi:hypothetical protein